MSLRDLPGLDDDGAASPISEDVGVGEWLRLGRKRTIAAICVALILFVAAAIAGVVGYHAATTRSGPATVSNVASGELDLPTLAPTHSPTTSTVEAVLDESSRGDEPTVASPLPSPSGRPTVSPVRTRTRRPTVAPSLPLSPGPSDGGDISGSDVPLPAAPTNGVSVSSRLEAVRSIVVSQGEDMSDLGALFNDSTSPQYRAAVWLADEDGLELPMNNDTFTDKVVQRYALAVLFYSTGGEYWKWRYDFLGEKDDCEWNNSFDAGVDRCDEEGRVTRFYMYWNNLTGTIPRELSYLTELTDLQIVGYDFSSTIPTQLGLLTNLKKLHLAENAYNSLSGIIPTELGKLTNLEQLHLQRNHGLSGVVPDFVGRLTELTGLNLHDNDLAGELPSTALLNLTRLREFRIFNTNVEGANVDYLCDALGDTLRDFHVDRGRFPCKCCECCPRNWNG